MNSEIKVSISCITFNHAPYIRECLDGFLMQRCNFKFEILIHDDASTDKTQSIIKEYQKKYPEIIKPILRKDNLYSKGERGFNARFNYTRAKGKYIAICEGDDFWTDPLKLQKQVDFLDNNPEVIVCFHNRSVLGFDGQLRKSPLKRYNNFKCDTIISSRKIINTFMPWLTIMFRSESVKEFSKLDSSGVFGGDIFLRAYLSTKGKAAYLNFDGAVYRQHQGGIYSGKDFLETSILAITTRELILDKIPNISKSNVYLSMFKIQSYFIFSNLKRYKISVALKAIKKNTIYFLNFILFSIKERIFFNK